MSTRCSPVASQTRAKGMAHVPSTITSSTSERRTCCTSEYQPHRATASRAVTSPSWSKGDDPRDFTTPRVMAMRSSFGSHPGSLRSTTRIGAGSGAVCTWLKSFGTQSASTTATPPRATPQVAAGNHRGSWKEVLADSDFGDLVDFAMRPVSSAKRAPRVESAAPAWVPRETCPALPVRRRRGGCGPGKGREPPIRRPGPPWTCRHGARPSEPASGP